MGKILIAYENFVIYNYCVMSKRPGKYIYSNKKHTEKGIFSTVLALLSFASIAIMLISSYANRGEVKGSFGAVAFICTLFSAIGIIVGVVGKNEPDKFYLFSYIGIIWNVVNLFLISAILYAGI